MDENEIALLAICTSILTVLLNQIAGVLRERWNERRSQEDRRAELEREAAGRASAELSSLYEAHRHGRNDGEPNAYRKAVERFLFACEDIYSAQFRERAAAIQSLLFYAADPDLVQVDSEWSPGPAFYTVRTYLRSALGVIRRATAEGRMDCELPDFGPKLRAFIAIADEYDRYLGEQVESEKAYWEHKRDERNAKARERAIALAEELSAKRNAAASVEDSGITVDDAGSGTTGPRVSGDDSTSTEFETVLDKKREDTFLEAEE